MTPNDTVANQLWSIEVAEDINQEAADILVHPKSFVCFLLDHPNQAWHKYYSVFNQSKEPNYPPLLLSLGTGAGSPKLLSVGMYVCTWNTVL